MPSSGTAAKARLWLRRSFIVHPIGGVVASAWRAQRGTPSRLIRGSTSETVSDGASICRVAVDSFPHPGRPHKNFTLQT